jgi:hypothetical protein
LILSRKWGAPPLKRIISNAFPSALSDDFGTLKLSLKKSQYKKMSAFRTPDPPARTQSSFTSQGHSGNHYAVNGKGFYFLPNSGLPKCVDFTLFLLHDFNILAFDFALDMIIYGIPEYRSPWKKANIFYS